MYYLDTNNPVELFKRVLKNKIYVDKSMLINKLNDFIGSEDCYFCITRPRRFGKTINMSMMAEFFDITKDSKEIFKGTKIMETPYAAEINQYPTIFISFADAKRDKETVVSTIRTQIQIQWDKYDFVFENLKGIDDAISFLMERMEDYYGKEVMVFIDEYDTPFMSALTGKYYENVKDLLTGMLSSALKDNEYLYKGVLTGIQRIAKENLFSGLNNLEVCSMQDEKYKDVFGFTEDETRTLLEAHHLELNQDVKEMYDGYTIGGIEIYNPWSVINYADKGVLASYWINTGSNEVVCQLLEKSSNKVKKQYIELLEKGEMKVNCILEGAYIELRGATQLWALLVHAGYLTIKAKLGFDEYVLRIVNGEVKQDLIQILKRIFSLDDCNVYEMFEMIQEGKIKEFEEAYQEILFNYPSYFDLKDENSYHVLMLGLCIIVSDSYEIMSNQEKGYGRADIYLKSKKGQRDIVIEMKYAENDKEDCLLASADKAMTQILDKHYGDDAIKIGIGNHQKKARITWKM